jgi:hypothetical protein
MLTEVDASALSPILLLKAEFDSGDVRLWSGYGDITFNSETYQGQGDWVAMSAVQEDGGIAARNASFKLMGQNAALLSIALSEPYQGRQITSWLGAFDEDTQAIIADPVKVFSGQMDVMEIEDTGEEINISINAESDLVRLEVPNVRRYTPEDQHIEHPNDRFFDQVAGLQTAEITWGKV